MNVPGSFLGMVPENENVAGRESHGEGDGEFPFLHSLFLNCSSFYLQRIGTQCTIFHDCYLNDEDGVSLIVARTASRSQHIIKNQSNHTQYCIRQNLVSKNSTIPFLNWCQSSSSSRLRPWYFLVRSPWMVSPTAHEVWEVINISTPIKITRFMEKERKIQHDFK